MVIKKLTETTTNLDALKMEVIPVLKAESTITPDYLNNMITTAGKERDDLQAIVNHLDETHEQLTFLLNEFEQQHKQLVS